MSILMHRRCIIKQDLTELNMAASTGEQFQQVKELTKRGSEKGSLLEKVRQESDGKCLHCLSSSDFHVSVAIELFGANPNSSLPAYICLYDF